jgi:hypothetical protein
MEGGLWFRAAVAEAIEKDGEWYVIDNDWRTRLITSDMPPVVRESNGRKELLLPFQPAKGAATIVQEYVW